MLPAARGGKVLRREAAFGPGGEHTPGPKIDQKLLGALYAVALGNWSSFVQLQLREFDDASAYEQRII